MKINDWLDVIDYKVLDGSKFEWEPMDDVFVLSWRLPFKGTIYYYSEVCFDTKTREVYYVEIYVRGIYEKVYC